MKIYHWECQLISCDRCMWFSIIIVIINGSSSSSSSVSSRDVSERWADDSPRRRQQLSQQRWRQDSSYRHRLRPSERSASSPRNHWPRSNGAFRRSETPSAFRRPRRQVLPGRPPTMTKMTDRSRIHCWKPAANCRPRWPENFRPSCSENRSKTSTNSTIINTSVFIYLFYSIQ